MSAQVEWDENVLVPEDIDTRLLSSKTRVDCMIVVQSAILERPHPSSDALTGEQSSPTQPKRSRAQAGSVPHHSNPGRGRKSSGLPGLALLRGQSLWSRYARRPAQRTSSKPVRKVDPEMAAVNGRKKWTYHPHYGSDGRRHKQEFGEQSATLGVSSGGNLTTFTNKEKRQGLEYGAQSQAMPKPP